MFRQLNKLEPHDREILEALGATLLKTGDLKDAEEAEQIFAALLRSYAWRNLYHGHGIANAALGKLDDALLDLTKAIELGYGQVDRKMLDTNEHPHLKRLEAERSDALKELKSRISSA